VRYQITAVDLPRRRVAALRETMGWRAYVTNAPIEEMPRASVADLSDEWLIDVVFHRLKGAPLSLTPLFVNAMPSGGVDQLVEYRCAFTDLD
jgi:hypothetical protein